MSAEIPRARMTYTVDEGAELLGIARHTAFQAARSGELPTIRIGRRLLVPRALLDAMLGVGAVDPEKSPAAEAEL